MRFIYCIWELTPKKIIQFISLVGFLLLIIGGRGLYSADSLLQAVLDGDYETVEKIFKGDIENYAIPVDSESLNNLRFYTTFYTIRTKAEVEALFDEMFNKYDIRSMPGWTPLNWAIFNDDTKMVKLLLQYDTDPNTYDKMNATPLHWASLWANGDIVKELMNNGAKISVRDNEGFTPLYRALQREPKLQDIEIIKFLIVRGAKLTRRDNMKRNAFHLATIMNNLEALSFIYSANPRLLNSLDGRGNSALHWAVASKGKDSNLAMVKTLVRMGINTEDENKESLTPFHLAVYRRNIPVVRYFLRNDNFDPNIQNYNGDTPIHIAARWGFADVIKIFHDVFYNTRAKQITIKRQHPVNPNLRNKEGYPPLNLALYYNQVLAAQELAKFQNLNPLEYDGSGETGLHLVARSRNLELMDDILPSAQSINSQEMFLLENNRNQRPIEVAAWNGDLDMVQFLIKRGGLVSNNDYDVNRLIANARTIAVERFLLRYKDDPKILAFE